MESHSPVVECVLSPHAFRALWIALVLLYGVVVVYLVAYAMMYALFYFIPLASYYVTTFQLLSTDKYPFISAVYLILAVVYAHHLLWILARSVRHRELRFRPRQTRAATSTQRIAPTLVMRYRRLVPTPIAVLYTKVVGVLSVHGPFFEIMTLSRELLEVIVQVQQAYQSSRYVASWRINTIFGILIVTNCFSTPLLHLWGGNTSSSGRFRLCVLLTDLMLDFIWFLVLPLLFWIPYVQALRGSESLLFDDSFMAKALMELQFLFVTSFADLVFGKVLPALSFFLALRKIQFLVQKAEPCGKRTGSRHQASARVQTRALAQIHPSPPAHRTSTTEHRSVSSFTHPRWLHATETALTVALTVIGLFAISVYVVAYGLYAPNCTLGCKLELRPWFVIDNEHCFCAVQEINCNAHGHHGEADALTRTLTTVEADGLLGLMFTHCSDLTVPREITRFRDLYRFEIFNCTIRSWDDDANVVATVFPRLGLLQLIYTFMSEIPSGILHTKLPPSLIEVEIVASNLTSLPLDLGKLWPNVETLYLEHAQFSTFPEALSRMRNLQSLSLYGNGLTSIPQHAFAENAFQYLSLSANPITAVPSSLRNSTKLVNLHLAETNIPDVETATQWHSPSGGNETTVSAKVLQIFGFGSPFCTPGAWAARPPSEQLDVVCSDRVWTYRGVSARSWYPLHAKLVERTLH